MTSSSSTVESERIDIAYNRIASRARQMVNRLAPLRSHKSNMTPNAKFPVGFPSFALPQPKPIVSALLDVGLPAPAAELVSQEYLAHASRLKQTSEQNAHSILRAHLDTNYPRDIHEELAYFTSIASVYRTRYETVLDEWIQSSVTRARSIVNEVQATSRPLIANPLKAFSGKKQVGPSVDRFPPIRC